MLTKKTLLAMICDLQAESLWLRGELEKLKHEVEKPKPIKRGENVDGVKRGRGRPRKQK